MGRWSWHASDLASGVELGTLAVATWEHHDILDDAGGFTATLASRGPSLDRLAIDSTLAARSVITPTRDGRPLGYAGIVWSPDPPTLSGSSLLSYFDTQTYDDVAVFTGIDQHAMVAELVNWVQTHDGNIQVDTSQVGRSGVARDQTWQPWDQKNIGDAIRQKGDNVGGFDFDVRVELDEAGNPVRRLRLWTPRRGRVFQADSSPVFTVGGNARFVPTAKADGTAMATHVVALGKEINPTTKERRIARAVRADLLAAGYRRLVKVLDLPDVDIPTLQQHADGYARSHGALAVDLITLDVNPDHGSYPWGSWDLGDDCRVVIPVGRDAWWPTGYNDTRRVIEHIWSYDERGERLQVVTGRLVEA